MVESGARQVENLTGSSVGVKRKREESEAAPAPAMSDEEMQRMLNEMEVSMMMGSFDPALSLPVADDFGPIDTSLLGFGDVPSFMDFASSPDFGTMWTSNTSTMTTGVF